MPKAMSQSDTSGKKASKKKRKQTPSPTTSPTSHHPAKVPSTASKMSEFSDFQTSMKQMLEQMFTSHTNQVKQLLQDQSSNFEKQVTELKNQQEELKSEIQSGNQALKLEFKNELQQLGETLRNEVRTDLQGMDKKIGDISTSLEAKISELSADLKYCSNRVEDAESDFDRIRLLNEIKIIGIEPAANEQLDEIFAKIANFFAFDLSIPTNIPIVKRLQLRDRKNGTVTNSKVIIAKFIAPHVKEAFYSLYLKKVLNKQMLNTSHIGIQQNEHKRVIIGENLTKTNANLFTGAQKLKRDGKIAQVYTNEGLVYVKVRKGDRASKIRDMGELAYMIQNPPPTRATTTNAAGTSTNALLGNNLPTSPNNMDTNETQNASSTNGQLQN